MNALQDISDNRHQVKIYFRGESCLDGRENFLKNARWVAYYYMDDGYEGHGCGMIAYTDGTYWCDDLGHCSCYGPFDSAPVSICGSETFQQAEAHIKEILGGCWKKERAEEKMREALADALKENPI